MCVIAIIDKERPSDDMVEKMWNKNRDGGGLAWRETDSKGERWVHWKKGIEKLDVMIDLCKRLPLPYIAHFRIATVGGVRQSLTHPFPISRTASLALEGKTKGNVLFQNGSWSDWDKEARAGAYASGTPIPAGKWSDTRAMAFLMAIYGIGFLELLPTQRGVAFGPTEYDIFTGGGWEKVDGIWCSNDHFVTKSYVTAHNNHHGSFYGQNGSYDSCKFPKCYRTVDLKEGYCPDHPNGVKRVIGLLPAEARGPQPVVPFSVANNPGQLLSLGEFERLTKVKNKKGERALSKNKFRKVQGWFSDLKGKNQKRAVEAGRMLRKLSAELNSAVGSIH